MKQLFTLVKAGLLALLPFLFATAKTVHFGPCFAASFTTPCLDQLREPANAVATLVAGFEAVIRLVPTERDFSFINAVARLVNGAVPNQATGYVSGQLATHGLA